MNRRLAFSAISAAVVVFAVWLIGEGIFSLARFNSPGRSATSTLLHRLGVFGNDQERRQPTTTDLQLISDIGEIRSLIGEMQESGIGLGNSPFDELKTEQARISQEEDGCLRQKPNLKKEMTFLRTTLFQRFEPLNAFYSVDAPMTSRLRDFIERYAFRRIRYTTNQDGERITLPAVESDRKVLIAGASIANGMMVNDDETISSQLQSADRSRQYVNIGVGGGGKMDDIVCSLTRAEQRYAGNIDQVIFVLGEIQLDSKNPFGTAERLIPWLAAYRQRNGIKRIVLVYIPYVYNSMPDVTRTADDPNSDFPFYTEEKADFLSVAKSAGLQVVDFLDATLAIRREVGSQFAPFVYYVDRSHLSRTGVAKLVKMIGSKP